MELEFESWMRFYGKESGMYRLEKGDFLSETYQEAISSATYVILSNFLPVLDKTVFCNWIFYFYLYLSAAEGLQYLVELIGCVGGWLCGWVDGWSYIMFFVKQYLVKYNRSEVETACR